MQPTYPPQPNRYPLVFELWIQRAGHDKPELYAVPAADPAGAVNRLSEWLAREDEASRFFRVISVRVCQDGIAV